MRGKKAIGIAGLITASIFVSIIIGGVFVAGKHLQEASDYIVCEESFAFNYATVRLSKNNFKTQFELLCFTQEISIEENGIFQESMRTKRIGVEEFTDELWEAPRLIVNVIGEKVKKEIYETMKEFAWGRYMIFSKWDEGIFSGGEKSRCFKAAKFTITDEFWERWNKENPASANVIRDVGHYDVYLWGKQKVQGKDYSPEEKIKENYYGKLVTDFRKGEEYEIIFRTRYNTGVGSGTWNLIATLGDPWYYQTGFYLINEKDERKYCNRMA